MAGDHDGGEVEANAVDSDRSATRGAAAVGGVAWLVGLVGGVYMVLNPSGDGFGGAMTVLIGILSAALSVVGILSGVALVRWHVRSRRRASARAVVVWVVLGIGLDLFVLSMT